MRKIDLIAVIFIAISLILIMVVPQAKLGYAFLISGDSLIIYSLIKEEIKKRRR
jgi:hypothetical protein